MFDLFHVLLYLHVLGSVMALGPTFAFPIIGGLSAKEPQHGSFALRLSLAIQDRLVVPIALTLAAVPAGTGSGVPPMGPPPTVMELIRRQRLTGTTLSVLILLILLLMVIQPGGAGA